MNFKNSIEHKYLLLLFIIPVIFLIFTISISLINYHNIYKEKSIIHINEASKIEDLLDTSFNYITNFAYNVGKKISDSNKHITAEIIGKILVDDIKIAKISRDIFALTFFDFITPNGRVIATSSEGALQEHIIINEKQREWIKLSPEHPWQLHLLKPDNPITNNKEIFVDKVIPAGYGITDNNQKFIGTISVGIDLNKLLKKINELLVVGTEFVLMDYNANIILASNKDLLRFDKDYFANKLALYSKYSSGNFDQKIKYHNDSYFYFNKLNNYPYIILIGEKDYISSRDFREKVLPGIIQTLIIGSLILALFHLFRSQLLDPILSLANIAKRISEGEQNVEIPPYYTIEVKYLADQLHKILYYTEELVETKYNLERAGDEVKKINCQLEDKVQERTFELEYALSAKTEFLNNMSHEIRTPIQGVKGISDGLVAHWTELNDDKKFEYANLISYSANRLHKLVGNLLDLTKFANNKMLLEFKPVDLSELVLDMIEECKLLYLHDKQIEIRFIEIKNAFISADAERISQVLRNLFTNAIKFAASNSILHAKLSLSEITYDDGVKIDAIHFALQDQGIGIPADELESIFTAFVQSSTTKTKAGGTGLGLSICREIIHAHHGKIWAENHKDGAIFNFVIPVIQDKQMDGHNIIAENDILFEKSVTTGNATILMIDDEDVCLSGMELILFGTNYQLIKHNTGHAGIDYLRTNKVDLILLDLMMPDMYGLNVLAEIKTDEALSHIPVILQTGTSDEAEINKAYLSGIFSYIKKPYNKNIVLSEIASALHSKAREWKENGELYVQNFFPYQ